MAAVFLEALAAALAEGIVAAIGYCLRKIRRWWRKRRKRDGGGE